MIHTVMSSNNSIIADWNFIKTAWLVTDDVQRQMFWEATLVKEQRKDPSSHLYDLQTYLDDDLKLWELLGTKLDEDRRTQIGAMVDLIRAAK